MSHTNAWWLKPKNRCEMQSVKSISLDSGEASQDWPAHQTSSEMASWESCKVKTGQKGHKGSSHICQRHFDDPLGFFWGGDNIWFNLLIDPQSAISWTDECCSSWGQIIRIAKPFLNTQTFIRATYNINKTYREQYISTQLNWLLLASTLSHSCYQGEGGAHNNIT